MKQNSKRFTTYSLHEHGFAGYRMVLGFAHLFLILALALITFVGIGYYAYKNGQIKMSSLQNDNLTTPTPSASLAENENWNTYTDEEYNYSIKYPSVWIYNNAKPPTFTSPETVGLPKYHLIITAFNNSRKTYDMELFKVWGSFLYW